MMTSLRRQMSQDYPNLDPTWAEEMMICLRVREVSGARIGEILAEADAHCEQAGAPASQVFGPAGDYAASLDFPGQQRSKERVTPSTLAGLAASLVGAGVTTWAGTALIEGQRVQIRVAEVLVTVLVLTLAWVAYRRLDWILRHIGWASAAFGLQLAASLALFLWGGPMLAHVPAGLTFAAGLVLLLGPALAQTPRALTAAPDDVVRPEAHRRRSARAIALATAWFLPVIILGMLAAQWLLAPGR